MKLLREHVAFLDYDVKRCMLEFFLLAQCLEGANSKYDQEIIIRDDLHSKIPCFACRNVKIVSLDDLKMLLPKHVLMADDGFRYPDATLQQESVTVGDVCHKCSLEPIQRTVLGVHEEIQSLSSCCPDGLRASLSFRICS